MPKPLWQPLWFWLEERRANCLVTAAGKSEPERSMWIRDAAYFFAAMKAVRRLEDLDAYRLRH